jgi:hypothetical protein
MKHLEKGLYENCGKYDFRELVAKELEKIGIMISDSFLLHKFIKKAEEEKIQVHIVDREVIPAIISCGLIDNNLLEVPKTEENVQEYVERVGRTCIERYLSGCGEYAKDTTLDILVRDMIIPSFYFYTNPNNNVKVPDLNDLTSFLTYSFLFGTGNRRNNIIIVYLDKETSDQLLQLLLHEEFHLIYDPSSSKYLDSKLYSEILEPYIYKTSLKSELENIGIIRGEEIAAEYVSLLTLKELGNEGTKLIDERKKIIEYTLSKIAEKIKRIGVESIPLYLRCYRQCPLKSYLLAYELLKYEEIEGEVKEFLKKYI